MDIAVLDIEMGGQRLGKPPGAVADAGYVARKLAQAEHGRIVEAVDARQPRTGAGRLLLKREIGGQIRRGRQLPVFLTGLRSVTVAPQANVRRDGGQLRPSAQVGPKAGRGDQEIQPVFPLGRRQGDFTPVIGDGLDGAAEMEPGVGVTGHPQGAVARRRRLLAVHIVVHPPFPVVRQGRLPQKGAGA